MRWGLLHKQDHNSSIYYVYMLFRAGSLGAGEYFQQSGGERRGAPWTDCQSITGSLREKMRQTLIYTGDGLELLINLTINLGIIAI